MNDSDMVHLYDTHFQSQHAAKCDLLIKTSNRRVSYAIVDQLQDQLKALYDAPVEQTAAGHLQLLAETDPYFKFHFRRVKVVSETRTFTFIPSDVFDESALPSYAAFVNLEKGEELRVTHLRNARVKNVTSIHKEVQDTTIHTFINPVFFSQADPLIESFLKFYYQPAARQLIIQVNTGTFEVLLAEGKKILVYNIFDNASADEFNYFLLLLITQSGINAAETPVLLCGEIDTNDERYQRIEKYFSHITFADAGKLMSFPEPFHELPAHRYYSLLSQNICE